MPLLSRNADLCKKKVRQIPGFAARTRYSYSSDFADAAQQELGLSDRLLITNVLRGSEAEKAGVRRGDIVVGIEGHEVSSGHNIEEKAAALMDGAMQRKNRFALTVRRNGSDMTLDVPATRACAFDVELGNADYVNAYSDGRRSLITAGMLDYARTDAELAIVVAKEIAHNIVMQRPRAHIVSTIDQLRVFDVLARTSPSSTKIRPYTAVMDATADKYSLYLLARTGHDIDKVLPFWKRLAGEFLATQPNSYTALHPSSAYRFSVMTAVSGVVKHHLKHRLPLVPH
ncbi:MAG: M48 family metalloprotease [Burkholderiaceae bacterium]